MDSQCPRCLGQAVVTSRLPCAIVGSPRRHERVPFVNIVSLRSRSIKLRQWKHKLDYYGVVFAHLATGCGINAKDPSGLDSDRWIQHSRCCENPARAKALAGFSRHLSAGFTDLNPAPRGLSLYNYSSMPHNDEVGACSTLQCFKLKFSLSRPEMFRKFPSLYNLLKFLFAQGQILLVQPNFWSPGATGRPLILNTDFTWGGDPIKPYLY